MSALEIGGIVYAAGAAAGMFYCGARGIKWGPEDWDDLLPFGPAWLSVIWPLLIPLVPFFAGSLFRRRQLRALEAAAERKKWLEAPLP